MGRGSNATHASAGKIRPPHPDAPGAKGPPGQADHVPPTPCLVLRVCTVISHRRDALDPAPLPQLLPCRRPARLVVQQTEPACRVPPVCHESCRRSGLETQAQEPCTDHELQRLTTLCKEHPPSAQLPGSTQRAPHTSPVHPHRAAS